MTGTPYEAAIDLMYMAPATAPAMDASSAMPLARRAPTS